MNINNISKFRKEHGKNNSNKNDKGKRYHCF